MKRPISFLILMSLLMALGFSSCTTSDNPVSQNEPTENESVAQVSTNSADIMKNITSFNQLSELMNGPDDIADLDIPEFQDPNSAAVFANSIQARVLNIVRSAAKDLQIIHGDTVIWDITEKDNQTGITHRFSLVYNTDDGKGRLFIVGFDYPESHPLVYDSTEIQADLNFTLLDDTDDVLLSLENLKRYKPGQLITEEQGRFEPDTHAPGTEPTGGVLTADVTYGESSFISHTNARFEYHEGIGGSYSKTSEFSDNTTHMEEATFNEDGTGSFSEMRRDGTSVEGTFDSAETDGSGSFSLTVTFPSGHDPVSVSESGSFTMNLADSTINGSFERVVQRLDGSEERESVTIDQTLVGDVLTTTLNVENADGSSGFITITESPDVDQIAGEWINEDQTFVKFTAQQYSDGSAHLVFMVWADQAAFENGSDPIASGEFDFYPDGSGMGTVTEDGKTYDVTIHPDGSVTIVERTV